MADRPWRGARRGGYGRGRNNRGTDTRAPRGNRGRGRGGRGQQSEEEPSSTEEQSLRTWSRRIPKSSTAPPLTRDRLAELFQTALILISGEEPGITHQVIQTLASDGGLLRILELTQIDTSNMDAGQRCEFIEQFSLPLLQTITHRDALSSLILEKPLGDIFIFLYGIQGRRGTPFLRFIATTLMEQQVAPEARQDDEVVYQRATIVLTALTKILDCNQSAAVNEDLHPIIDTIQLCLGGGAVDLNGGLIQQAALYYMHKVRRYLDYGADIATLPQHNATMPTSLPVFELNFEGPGTLSTAGARHDNDKIRIADIKILPTTEEIASHRAEYLPGKDASRWHFPGIQGLLDQQFRLLREDTVGQLRDCVRTVMEDLCDRESKAPSSKDDFQGSRIYRYSGVYLSELSYEKRRKSLIVAAHFDQPGILTHRSPSERQRWWDESKQLQIDSLLCYVDSDGHTSFFSVAERGGMKIPERGVESGDEETYNGAGNVKAIHNLWNDANQAVVTLRLIDLRNQNFAPVLGQDLKDARTRQVLVEFPGVLLPSFQPTLEALQQMSVHGDVPFSNLLVHKQRLPHKDAIVSWPRYAQQRGFAFDLSPIIDNGDPIYLKPTEKFDPVSLERRSTLDGAQCRALIGALSRNLALVQGPPGTGKSFVAVQAVKVLIAHRREAEMNPIICV